MPRTASSPPSEPPSAALAALLGQTVETLRCAGVEDEALGVMKRARGLAALSGASRLVPVGRAWRLGVLLLDGEARLYSTGDVTRAIEPLRAVTNRSAQAEARREDRRAAARGRFTEGEVVNFGHELLAIDPDSLAIGDGPVSLIDGVIVVRWNGTAVRPLTDYLADRSRLLVEGAI